MSFVIDTLTMPKYPYSITETNPSDIKAYPFPGSKPILISMGLKSKVLEIECWLVQAGQTKAYLETTYITPLKNKLHNVVTLDLADTRYDGSWIFDSLVVQETYKFGTRAFKLKMKFMQGSSHTVI